MLRGGKESGNGYYGSAIRALPGPGAATRTHSKQLSGTLLHILKEVEREIGYDGVDGESDNTPLESSHIESVIARVSERLGFQLTTLERDEILSFIEREQKPFGVLQELVDDEEVSDIIITDSSKITVQQGRRNFSTGISFPDAETYEAFIERLLKRAGTTYSTKKPIADGMIGSFARVHAVHRSLCETGPYVTIRLNRFSSVSVGDLLKSGSAPKEIFDYLKGIVEAGKTLLLIGEVGTGKTTLARALSASIPQNESILVIEDTPEIRLEHPHVRYMRTRDANTDGEGRVTPSECIRGGMRMAMNRIIFGEIRDAEAAEAFVDVCASGHPGLSTIHARRASEAVTRLELFLGRAQKGVSRQVLREQIVTAVQVIVFVDICKVTGKRRIMEVQEIGPIADDVIRHRDIFRYDASNGAPTWKVLNKVSSHREALEALRERVVLSAMPNVLTLSSDVAYRETALAAVA